MPSSRSRIPEKPNLLSFPNFRTKASAACGALLLFSVREGQHGLWGAISPDSSDRFVSIETGDRSQKFPKLAVPCP
ncbi:hypothetical protein [Baaleninema sp.]|uniref:hypothetical protein n=1 Tax=Baaleninema sp. TaxID=3101197 RepID=UPI003D0388EC